MSPSASYKDLQRKNFSCHVDVFTLVVITLTHPYTPPSTSVWGKLARTGSHTRAWHHVAVTNFQPLFSLSCLVLVCFGDREVYGPSTNPPLRQPAFMFSVKHWGICVWSSSWSFVLRFIVLLNTCAHRGRKCRRSVQRLLENRQKAIYSPYI